MKRHSLHYAYGSIAPYASRLTSACRSISMCGCMSTSGYDIRGRPRGMFSSLCGHVTLPSHGVWKLNPLRKVGSPAARPRDPISPPERDRCS